MSTETDTNEVTNTPRTDVCPHCGAEGARTDDGISQYYCQSIYGDEDRDPLCFERQARQKAEAEVEFWKAKAYEAEESEGKHEAHVERLRSQLKRAVEIADEFFICSPIGVRSLWNEAVEKLAALKEEIK